MAKVTVFQLCNKDKIVLEFSMVEDLYTTNYQIITIKNKSLIPLDFRDLSKWIESRYILNYRKNIQVFFNLLGIQFMSDFISITHCISLRDTYWVCSVRDTNITWSRVSPYCNPLNKVIADYSMDRKIEGKVISGSPDFSTDGNFPKCWKRSNGEIYLYKAGSSGFGNAGNEPFCEVYAYKIAKSMGIDCVEYTIGSYKGIPVSRCKCSTNETTGLISHADLYNEAFVSFPKLLDTCNIQIKDKVIDMLLLDYVTCNIDRHYGNIGYLVNNNTNRVLTLSKLYDHNLSCLPYFDFRYGESLEGYIEGLLAKDGRSFPSLYGLIKSRRVLEKLKLLKGKDFSIGYRHDEVVNKLVQYQINKIL